MCVVIIVSVLYIHRTWYINTCNGRIHDCYHTKVALGSKTYLGSLLVGYSEDLPAQDTLVLIHRYIPCSTCSLDDGICFTMSWTLLCFSCYTIPCSFVNTAMKNILAWVHLLDSTASFCHAVQCVYISLAICKIHLVIYWIPVLHRWFLI